MFEPGSIDIYRAIQMIVIILIAIDIHELAHAVVADRLGDPTPSRMGQLSLNPFVHMDQFGVILLLITSLTPWAFTYGRTHVTPANLRFGPQRGNAIVAIVGPLSNLLLAATVGVALALSYQGFIDLPNNVEQFLVLAMALNILLFLFNLLPLPPLDGFSVLGGFLSARQMYSLAPLQQWGPLVLIVILVAEPYLHIFDALINPAIFQIGEILCSGCLQ